MTQTRIAEAQRLVDEGGVAITSQSEYGVSAIVHSNETYYQTFVYVTGHFVCDCSWGRIHSHTDDLCAHALALKLVIGRELGDA